MASVIHPTRDDTDEDFPPSLCRHVRPHRWRQGAPGRHRPVDRSRKRLHHLWRRGEVRRRQGDPRRHGPEPAVRRRGGRYPDHQRADPRPLGHRQGRRGPQGRPHRRHRQGRQPGHSARRDHRDRRQHRSDRRRRHDPHRRRHRLAYSLHLPAADRRGADERRDHHDRRRHGSGHRHQRHHGDARPLAHGDDAQGRRRLSDEHRLHRQGQRLAARAADRAGQGRSHRPQAARGLGHHPGGHRQLPVGRRSVRRAGGHPYRHAERIGLRRDHPRRVQGPHHPHLPHRRRWWRPRARHHQGLRLRQRAAQLDQPDPAVHPQHHRRAPGHAHGLPPPRSEHRRGRGLRREPYPPRDHRRRRHPA